MDGDGMDMMSVVKKAAKEAGIDLGKMRRRNSVQIHASMEAIANAEFNDISAPLREAGERDKAAKTIQQHFREFMEARRPHIETRDYAPSGDRRRAPSREGERRAVGGEVSAREPTSGQVGRRLPADKKGKKAGALKTPEKGVNRARARRASWSGPINFEDRDKEEWTRAKQRVEALPKPDELPLPTFRASVGTPPLPSSIRVDDHGLLEVSEGEKLEEERPVTSEPAPEEGSGPSTPPASGAEEPEAPRMPLLQVRSMTKVPAATAEKALEEAIEGAIESIENMPDLNRPFVVYKSIDAMPSYLDKYAENPETSKPGSPGRGGSPMAVHMQFDFGKLGVMGEQMGLTEIRLGSTQGRDPQTIQDLIQAHLYFRLSDQSPVVVHICENDPCTGFCGTEGCSGSLPKVGFCGSFMCWGEENCGVPGCPGGRGSLKAREELDTKAEAYVAAVRARRAITPMRLVEPLQKGQVLLNASPGTLRGSRLKKYPPSPLLQKRSQQLDEPFEDRYDQMGGMCRGKRGLQFSGGFYGQRSQKSLTSPLRGKLPPGGEPSRLDRNMMSTVRSTTKTRLTYT